MEINTGILPEDRKQIAHELSKLLADTYSLYLKTQGFHWNVTGMQFTELHFLFEKQYMDLAGAVDEIAERIRALGFPAPASYSQFTQLTQIQEETGVPSSKGMIEGLINDNEAIIRTSRNFYGLVEKAQDEATADVLTRRIETHEKTAWMLRSLLD